MFFFWIIIFRFSYTSHGLDGGPLSPNNFPLEKPHQNQDTENKDLTPKIKNQIPKDDCKKLLADFSTCVSNYTECTTVFARPIRLCLRCRDKYLSVMSAYRSMENFKQDNVSCKEVLTNQDRLSIIDHTYQDITDEESIWETASCKSEFMNKNVFTIRCLLVKDWIRIYSNCPQSGPRTISDCMRPAQRIH